jgi:hypothetical protein
MADYKAALTFLEVSPLHYFTLRAKSGKLLKTDFTFTHESLSKYQSCRREFGFNVTRVKKMIVRRSSPEEYITTSPCPLPSDSDKLFSPSQAGPTSP